MDKIVKNLLFIFFTFFCLSSCTTAIYQKKNVLSNIQRGMTQEEVVEVFGTPDFRRFRGNCEEWEYRKWLSGNDAIIQVFFENGRVEGMDSFECPPTPQTSTPPSGPVTHYPPVIIQNQQSTSQNQLRTMSHAEFQQFYQKVKAEPFSKDRTAMIKTLANSKQLTCRQCAQLLTFFSFSNEKMDIFRLFAPRLVDRENYKEIQNQFPSSFDKQDVKKILGIL